ncbi:hypothetical protein MKX03_025681 [Papaver bracteatum]|nr:hypothetical protein MKX03_025681 [Papaver bracteatum]
MPKVHGSGTQSHNFKRQRISEYPAGISYLSPDKKPLSTNPFNPDLAKEIYEPELSVKQDHNKTVSFHRVMNLEVSRYLEASYGFLYLLNILLFMVDRKMEMCLDPNLINKWHILIKKQSKEAEKRGEPFDLLSKFLRPVVADVAVVPKCHLSALYNHPKRRLFALLVDLLQLYEGFEINYHTGTQLSDDNVVLVHHFLIEAFQFLASKKIRKLKELALANVGLIRSDLTKKLSVLSPEELQDLVCNKYELLRGCLAFPKLNLQFPSLHDYLLRIFNLFRLESTLEFREDIQEAVQHLLAYLNVEGKKLLFEEFRIKVVKQPNVGEVKPASVTEDVMFTQDVLFLLSICPSSEALSSEEAAKLTYFMDVNDIAEEVILEPIRDLVNESCIVPNWLHSMFLGYENSSAAQWTNMPDFLGTVDFKDMFLDADHLRMSFPHYQFPKALQGSMHALLGNTKLATDAHNDLIVEAYVPHDPGLYLQNQPRKNSFRFTPIQVGANISGIHPGLTMVVGPPGTGKTDTAGQILNVLYHKESTDLDFSWQSRVNAMLVRRLELLAEVERLARSLQLPEDWFPFGEFFSNTVLPVFSGQSFEKRHTYAAEGCFRHLPTIFQELEVEECRGFELLKSTADRENYLMTKQAKIVAMTCTHEEGFPSENGYARLKRCILTGDYHQLPLSLFARFVRLGIPYIELNAQGRAKPNVAMLYNWRYRDLRDLPIVREGESAPSPWFYQNEGEAEYIVSVYVYMRLLVYNGQKLLIRDVLSRRCSHPFIGPPSKQNGFVLLSDKYCRLLCFLSFTSVTKQQDGALYCSKRPQIFRCKSNHRRSSENPSQITISALFD